MYVSLDGVKIFYEVYGSKSSLGGNGGREKPTFIFIHGGAGFLDHTPYVPFWSRFSDVAEVIFIDSRGSGRSVNTDKDSWTLKQWGKDIYNFCQALDIKKPIVGGISYGGMVSMSYSMQYPDHPRALILSDTDVHIDRGHMLELVKEKLIEHDKPVEAGLKITNQILDGPITDEVFKQYFYDVLNLFGEPDEVIDDFSLMDPKLVNYDLAVHFMNGELLSVDYRDKLKGTQCPVLFLSGDQGPLHSLKTAKELIAAFPEDKIQAHFFKGAKPACYEFDPKKAEMLVRNFMNNTRED